ncbi:DUF4154 domain-containing protein [Novosphingobium sp. FSY-8]|uniref:DUF4154 domain-containing protein n=1 Tax=Novosphingobium ovatum TaxID=1908523 RepID=A0ABW9XF10_9SPHN|nr:YfiR family protein [Novosphingobium ovatum]NBC37116.1 DUF4154 domain-containing protein [Novosphingobium ovatum]
MRARRFHRAMRVAVLAMLGGGLICLTPAPVAANGGNGVKAAMIYNILRFMTLPDARPRVRLCVRRADELAPDLLSLNGEPVGAGQLEVVPLANLTDARGCDALYVGNAPITSAPAPGRGQVLIGDGGHFAEDGGTVGLISFGGQTRFAINARVAAHSGVRISSQVMRLAARIVN